jgi:hypothetical protein
MLNVSIRSRHVFPRISCYFSKIASTHSGWVQIRRLEVERKFLVTPVAVSYLRSNGRGSGFKKYESLGKQTTQDTYYDRNGLLFSEGVYIRRRNGHWEAKIRGGGDFNYSSKCSMSYGRRLKRDLLGTRGVLGLVGVREWDEIYCCGVLAAYSTSMSKRPVAMANLIVARTASMFGVHVSGPVLLH